MAAADPGTAGVADVGGARDLSRRRLALGFLALSFIGLLVVGLTGPNAASPDLGARGWAPGSLPGISAAATAAALTAAYVLGGLGVGLGWLSGLRPCVPWWPVVALAVLALLAAPFGSADHVNYAAYGRILVQGGDPYTVSPLGWHGGTDPITSHVEAPWTTTPSIYGPLATLFQGLSALLGGDNLRQAVWVWQLLVVACWLLARVLLRRLTDDHARVDLLWTLNPLVFGPGVLGAHVDLLATALVLLALCLAWRSPLLAGVATGLALCTKVTYAVVGVALVLAWARAGRSEALRRVVAFVAGVAVVAVPLHLALGPHVYAQLEKARRSVSLGTPWRPLVEVLTGPLRSDTVRNLVFALAAVATILLIWALSQLTRDLATRSVVGEAIRWTFVLSAAYALAAPYSLPWYDQLAWATLPALAASRLDLVLLGRAVSMAVAYVPGRVLGMTPGVERLTLGFRRFVAPYAGLLAWAAIGWLSGGVARRGAAGSTGSRPPGSAPRSR